jgi:hypothetical protein
MAMTAELREGICACGCGKTFQTGSDTRIYLDAAHQGVHYSARHKAANEAAKLMEPPEDRDARDAPNLPFVRRKTYPRTIGTRRSA